MFHALRQQHEARNLSGPGWALRVALVLLMVALGLGGKSGSFQGWMATGQHSHVADHTQDGHVATAQALAPSTQANGQANVQQVPATPVGKDHGPGQLLHIRADQRVLHTAWASMIASERIVRITLRRCQLLFPFHVFW
ncbi:MAG: hypothetical protein KF905_07825 [Flavobacteriales bacterium]|nr:hypothetical protein [Flavobacteriales bacterium]